MFLVLRSIPVYDIEVEDDIPRAVSARVGRREVELVGIATSQAHAAAMADEDKLRGGWSGGSRVAPMPADVLYHTVTITALLPAAQPPAAGSAGK
jgi:hypothetical protein